jgi:hypothetical protein
MTEQAATLISKVSTNLLDVDLNVLLQVVAVQVEDKVVNEVETVADDDEGKLVSQLGLLQEVLDPLRVVAVALAADPLHFLDLASLARGLNTKNIKLWLID